jgi:hypothetical protein
VQVDTIRPTSTRAAGSGTAQPSGTLHGVTADNSDSTYIRVTLTNPSPWSLRLASHTPPANHQRHRIRARTRGRTDAGSLGEDIDLGRGTSNYIRWDSVVYTNVVTEFTGSWFQDAGYGLATAGALADLNIGGGYPTTLGVGSPTELRTMECYVDIDCRARPAYTAQVRDAAGVSQGGGTVTDTNQPTLYFGGVAYDGLPPLDWQVTLDGVVVASGSGVPPASVSSGNLANGAHSAQFRVRSTVRVSDPFEHVQTVSFSVANVVPAPSPPLVSVTEEFGGYRVTWVDPGGQQWDNNYVVAEVWRDDCTGSQRIATVPDGLNGSYLDLAIPQLDPQVVDEDGVCTTEAAPCDITYRVRYRGYVSTFVELPDTIPAQMILAWPGTVGTIPSGWTRVTSLDGVYPRGATTTGTPSATGGNASHSHTLPGHAHTIGAHSHSVGGSTGSSNASATSARFNGASQPQADQPHTHSRPSATGSAGPFTSGTTAPGTSAANNLPPTREVIWIQSNGSQPQYPTGILGWATESVSGWVDDVSSSGRFLRGAAAAGNGGASTGSSTHDHTVNAHTHTGVNHSHSIGNTGLSNPSSSQEAGTGSQTPRWLPRHTHPMSVSTENTNGLNSGSGGTVSTATTEPLHRRLRVLRNTGGGTQTRIIGLYIGTVAALDPLLTLCNGGNGTPDMRTWFARDVGGGSVNSTGGTASHTHAAGTHNHTITSHNHDTEVETSNNTSYEAPSFGDLGPSPTTGHTHSSGATGSTVPSVSSPGAGTTNAVDQTPPYREVHFVRLDGTISGGPLPVPELKVSDFAGVTVDSFTYGDGLDRLATFTDKMAVVTDRSHDFPRLVVDSVPLDGGLHQVSTTLAGEDATLTIGVEGKQAIDRLEELLSADRVYWSPVGGTPGWFAPAGWTTRGPAPDTKVITITMVRQPWPAVADPAEFL